LAQPQAEAAAIVLAMTRTDIPKLLDRLLVEHLRRMPKATPAETLSELRRLLAEERAKATKALNAPSQSLQAQADI
jgi:hypothetical protein